MEHLGQRNEIDQEVASVWVEEAELRDRAMDGGQVAGIPAEQVFHLSQLYQALQERAGFRSECDRIDLPLASMAVRAKLVEQLQQQPLTEVAGRAVVGCPFQLG